MRARALACAALAAFACGGESGHDEKDPALTAAGPQLRPVVAEAIAALEAELAATDPRPPPPDEAAVEAVREPVEALLEALAASSERDSMRPLLVEELAQLGDAIVPHLAAWIADREADPARRSLAAEALASLDSPAGTEVLLAKVESSRLEVDPETWLIAQCAWWLSHTGGDWIVPRILLCLRYEKDHETVLWLADTLAQFGNYSGLEGLRVIATGDSKIRERAAGLYVARSNEAGFQDGAELERAWAGTSQRSLPPAEPSPRLTLEIWRQIRALSEWQLRGVDDGRFVLSRSGRAAADQLAQALSDEDVYIRVHSAQCLERMGPRALAAAPALERALDDPSVAPAAAAALAGLGSQASAPALAARLSAEHPLELRVAAARALGGLPGHAAADALRALSSSEEEAIDLCVSAAGALVRTAPLDEVEPAVRLLRSLLSSKAVEVTEVEAALGDWLARLEDDELSASWATAADAERAERLAQRALLVDSALE